MPSSEVPSVAILVDTATGWGRRLIRGIIAYVNKHGPWDVWLEPQGQHERLRLPRGWRGDGAIARISSRAMADHLHAANCPVVNVSAIRVTGPAFPRVTTDAAAVARLAVEHFQDRGIHQFGYVGLPRRAYSIDRQRVFAAACHAAGCSCLSFTPRDQSSATTAWQNHRDALRQWLVDLPKPAGILTWGVRRGMDIIYAARPCGLQIPDDVAVLCGDDDELLCESVSPSLSGINVPSEQIGHESAALLDRLMKTGAALTQPIYLEPTGINARASTDVLALRDSDVVAAVRFIRKHADQLMSVDDVATSVAVGRRSLERRFQKELNRTIGDEIARVHLERAKQLLAETDMPIPQVAVASGFGSPEYMATVFRRAVGLTPRKYRTQVRGR